ncbi:MAG: DNA polymerase III subunit beta [Oscillospiraceae bacterium]|jgi:DNA polymerase III sliding clamp (beta) subunit (PCNA family)|nr:DNA polymerase III subunit beta [Oscillospiraceae bacterium]
MKFSINRAELLAAAKSMLKVVPASSPMKELEGFLVESDEDAGEIIMTATNMTSSIQRRLPAQVRITGSCVINARLLTGMCAILRGDTVYFEKLSNGTVYVSSLTCNYNISALPVSGYPKPVLPFPDDTIKVSGIRDLYAATAASVGRDMSRPALTGVHLEIYSDCVRATSCDTFRLATVKRESETGGALSVVIPKISLQDLAGAVTNEDVLEVGVCGGTLVFIKRGLIFSTRLIDEAYIDTDKMLAGIESCYIAKVDGKQLADAIGAVSVIADSAPDCGGHIVNMCFTAGEIVLSARNELSAQRVSAPASVSKETPDGGFWYNPRHFADCFKTVGGAIELHVAKTGVLLIRGAGAQYMLLNVRPPKQARAAA